MIQVSVNSRSPVSKPENREREKRKMKKVVCLYGTPSPLYNELNKEAKEYALKRNLEYIWVPQMPFTTESAVAALKEADAGIIDVEPYDKRIFSQVRENIKILVRYGVGFDAVNLQDASECGIAVARTTAANAQSVAEMALAMIMGAKRQFGINRSCIESGKWVRNIGAEMMGKSVGILGFGAVGRRLARLFSGFDAKILVYDPYLNEEAAAEANVHKVDLDTLFTQSDAISIHMPYNKETHHLVNADRLSQMKETAVIVCTARGGIVDEDALYEVLKEHKILGAGLDVFAQEPLPATSALIGLDNIILTPHVAAQTRDSLWNIYKRAIDITADFLEGKSISKDLLNPDYKLSR